MAMTKSYYALSVTMAIMRVTYWFMYTQYCRNVTCTGICLRIGTISTLTENENCNLIMTEKSESATYKCLYDGFSISSSPNVGLCEVIGLIVNLLKDFRSLHK